MKKILITNDDGINASGIIRLAAAAASYGEVWVVAPVSERSAASHSVTLRQPIDVCPAEFPVKGIKAFSCTGTPTDCVRIGVQNIVPGRPDIVFSGINYGYNAGSDVQYSATVGAAMEALFLKIPAVAFSESRKGGSLITDQYLDAILREALLWDVRSSCILNINFPGCAPEEFRGILRDRFVSKECTFQDVYHEEPLPGGGFRYTVEGLSRNESEEGSDIRALHDHYISMGPIRNLC